MSSEVERKLLARLTTPRDIAIVYDAGVRPELFFEPIYQAVYNTIIDYWRTSKMLEAPTPWVIQQEHPGFNVGQDSDETTEYLADLMRRRFQTNKIQEMILAAGHKAAADPQETLKELLASAFFANEATVRRDTRTNMADTIEEDRAAYDHEADYPQGMGRTYGLDLLDLHTGGLMPGELAVVGGRVKTGKTMLGLNIMARAVRQGNRPMVFTLEMGLKEIRQRLAALFSGVSYDRLSHRHLSQDEQEQLWAGRQELAGLGGIQIEAPEEGDRTVAALISRARQYNADYVFIDQLSEMEVGHKFQTLKEHHASIVKQLKREISRAGQELPVVLACQLRRGDEEISLESFSNATEIEATADILFGLWRSQDMRNNGVMALDVLGSRRSDTVNYLLNWTLTSKTEITIARRRV